MPVEKFEELYINVPGKRYNRKICVRREKIRTRYRLKFPFNRTLIDEVKNLEGAKWDPDGKFWSIPIQSQRNDFVFDYLLGNGNPYSQWRKDIDPGIVETHRPLYEHQRRLAAHILTVRHGIWGAEMGTGKTLAAITAMEHLQKHNDIKDWWWVGTRASLRAVQYEFAKWDSQVVPTFESYHMLRRCVEEWQDGKPAPQGIIFDESSKIKTPTAQMSKAAKHIADSIRIDHGYNSVILLMSGSPAPKNPADWWHQCEVSAPGYLKEGHQKKLLQRLAFQEKQTNNLGVTFPKFKCWFDGSEVCKNCGETRDAHLSMAPEACFNYVQADNEVHALYKRMRGLVQVELKKDCLDLPDKRYEKIQLKVTPSLKRAARTMVKTAKNQMTALITLRMLSDGFLYEQQEDGVKDCEACHGSGEQVDPETMEKVECLNCKGSKEEPKYRQITKEIDCPKIGALEDLLEQHEDVGRIVIYGGLTGSVDRVVKTCQRPKKGAQAPWSVIRWDGRGVMFTDHMNMPIETDPLKAFQEMQDKFQRIAFVGQPDAAGMGLTLTASPSIVYYSNTFNAESRIQSEDRIHRPGMDANKGATIYDLMHLPTDALILANLQRKRELQKISMGEIEEVLQ